MLGLLVRVTDPPLLLIQPLAVVHDAADRRLARRGHLDEIQANLTGPIEGILLAHDTDLVICFVNQPNRIGPDPPVNA